MLEIGKDSGQERRLQIQEAQGGLELEDHLDGDYADCVAQGSPNSIIIYKGLSVHLQTETGNESTVEAW